MSSVRTVVKAVIPTKLFTVIEPFGHLLEAILWNVVYGFPARDMHVIGVTGTNGKTTTSFMIHRMLTDAGYKTALMTTVAYGVGNDITPQEFHMTTVSSKLLQRRLREFKKQGAKWLILETTSHALAQYRVWGVRYEVAVVTNVTHEHLDYHGTYERYVAAKRKLFELVGRRSQGFGIVNADDDTALPYASAVKNSVSYGIRAGDIQASEVQVQATGSTYSVKLGDDAVYIHCNIPGEFNVYNSLAAVAVGTHLGLTHEQIQQGIANLKGVEGRMNTIDEGQDFSVIIDYAHTPDSFERLLSDVRKSTKGKLVVLFGSAGRRDEAKRAIQGEIAGQYGDEVVLTEEDDRDIDGNEILAQIASGAEKAGKLRDKDLFMILDRSTAIEFAMTRATSKDDTVILLGKGHEKTIERADGEHPWSEVDEARRAIQALA